MMTEAQAFEKDVIRLEKENTLLRAEVVYLRRELAAAQQREHDTFVRGMPGHPDNEMGM
jgi:hypothetical protein